MLNSFVNIFNFEFKLFFFKKFYFNNYLINNWINFEIQVFKINFKRELKKDFLELNKKKIFICILKAILKNILNVILNCVLNGIFKNSLKNII